MNLITFRLAAVVVAVSGMMAELRGDQLPTLSDTGIVLSPETTAIIAPLRDDGAPDYIRALNDQFSVGVTPENNAFVAWLNVVGTEKILSNKTKKQILQMCGAKDSGAQLWVDYNNILKKHGITNEKILSDDDRAGQQLWSQKDFPFVAEYLQENESFFDRTKEAFSRSHYWLPYAAADGRSMISVLIPSLGRLRDVSRGLCARATLRASAGDFDGFLSDIMCCKQIARKMSAATAIEHLVGISIEISADKAVGVVAGSGILSAKQCDRLNHELSHSGPLPPLWKCIDLAERWNWLDVTIQLAQGRTNEISRMIFEDDEAANELLKVNRHDVNWNNILRLFNTIANRQIAAMKSPTIAEFQRVQQELMADIISTKPEMKSGWGSKGHNETSNAYTQRIAAILTNRLVTDLEYAELRDRQSSIQTSMVHVVVMAAKYHAEKKAWPKQLSDLAPSYLQKIPDDIYSSNDNHPIQSNVNTKGFYVYIKDIKDKEIRIGAE